MVSFQKQFEDVEREIEDEIAKRLNPYAQSARTAAWISTLFLCLIAISMVANGALVIPVFLVFVAIVLVWLLRMSRPVTLAEAPTEVAHSPGP